MQVINLIWKHPRILYNDRFLFLIYTYLLKIVYVIIFPVKRFPKTTLIYINVNSLFAEKMMKFVLQVVNNAIFKSLFHKQYQYWRVIKENTAKLSILRI